MPELCGCSYHPIKSSKWEHCRRCGRTPEQVGFISVRGRCGECGIGAAVVNMRSLADKSGPEWERYIGAITQYALRLAGKTTVPDR